MFQILYREDTLFGDVTSDSVIPENMDAEGYIFSREKCIVAGVEYISRELFNMGLMVETYVKDGELVKENTAIMKITGNARDILKIERTTLNILGRMSGVSTLTASIVEKVHAINPNVRVAATRKTLWSYLDKMAVKMGGGDPHRWNLGDMVMIKDNHIALVGLKEAIERAKSVSFSKKIEVEVENEKDAMMAAEMGVDIILLDNMDPEEVCEISKKLRDYAVLIEVSGGITPQNIEEYARCDIDIISLGYLTHSARSINFSMELNKRD